MKEDQKQEVYNILINSEEDPQLTLHAAAMLLTMPSDTYENLWKKLNDTQRGEYFKRYTELILEEKPPLKIVN